MWIVCLGEKHILDYVYIINAVLDLMQRKLY